MFGIFQAREPPFSISGYGGLGYRPNPWANVRHIIGGMIGRGPPTLEEQVQEQIDELEELKYKYLDDEQKLKKERDIIIDLINDLEDEITETNPDYERRAPVKDKEKEDDIEEDEDVIEEDKRPIKKALPKTYITTDRTYDPNIVDKDIVDKMIDLTTAQRTRILQEPSDKEHWATKKAREEGMKKYREEVKTLIQKQEEEKTKFTNLVKYASKISGGDKELYKTIIGDINKGEITKTSEIDRYKSTRTITIYNDNNKALEKLFNKYQYEIPSNTYNTYIENLKKYPNLSKDDFKLAKQSFMKKLPTLKTARKNENEVANEEMRKKQAEYELNKLEESLSATVETVARKNENFGGIIALSNDAGDGVGYELGIIENKNWKRIEVDGTQIYNDNDLMRDDDNELYYYTEENDKGETIKKPIQIMVKDSEGNSKFVDLSTAALIDLIGEEDAIECKNYSTGDFRIFIDDMKLFDQGVVFQKTKFEGYKDGNGDTVFKPYFVKEGEDYKLYGIYCPIKHPNTGKEIGWVNKNKNLNYSAMVKAGDADYYCSFNKIIKKICEPYAEAGDKKGLYTMSVKSEYFGLREPTYPLGRTLSAEEDDKYEVQLKEYEQYIVDLNSTNKYVKYKALEKKKKVYIPAEFFQRTTINSNVKTGKIIKSKK